MRVQSLPSLSRFLYLSALLITSALLPAQQLNGSSTESSDQPATSLSSAIPTPLPPSLTMNNPVPSRAAVPANSITSASQSEFALEAFTAILDQYRKAGNRDAEAHTLCALANAYNDLHQQQKAVEHLQSALVIFRQIGDKDGEATTLAHIGDVYRVWGFPQQAVPFYRDALKVYPATNKKAEQAAVFNNLGLSFFLLGDKKKCVSYFDEAYASYHALHDRQGEAFALTNLGSAYGFLLNDPHKSLDYFQQAVTSLELLNDRESEANALDIMGELWLKLGKPEIAGLSFQHALSLFTQSGDLHGEASVRKHMTALGVHETIASNR